MIWRQLKLFRTKSPGSVLCPNYNFICSSEVAGHGQYDSTCSASIFSKKASRQYGSISECVILEITQVLHSYKLSVLLPHASGYHFSLISFLSADCNIADSISSLHVYETHITVPVSDKPLFCGIKLPAITNSSTCRQYSSARTEFHKEDLAKH